MNYLKMNPKEILKSWDEYFNNANLPCILNLYDPRSLWLLPECNGKIQRKRKERTRRKRNKKKVDKLIRMMNQLNFESPCINNCKLNEITNICEGCGRTIKEIMQWTFMTNEERKEIMKRVGGRTLWKHYYLYVFLL